MDSPFLEEMVRRLVSHDVSVVRFEFPYMQERRSSGRKRPPDRQPVLLECWRQMIDRYQGSQPLFIAGKSMGGRMATLVACEALPVQGVIVLGYPFHPPGKPDRLRIEHFTRLRCPALILQGERDPFGSRAEVCGYQLPPPLEIQWLAQGDHDLAPSKRSGISREANLDRAAVEIDRFVRQCMEHNAAGESRNQATAATR